ncbi:GIY-YIG nuclease family protein [Lederbergia citrisecunda]|uniref:GIY-YIG nuclease family protein n=1 Tax=Lederbergia citrisecunda TaxID=2833583 RepID=UPI003D26B8F7
MRNIDEMTKYRGKHGIYYIIEEFTKRVYIGSSVDIYRRTRNHFTDLQSNLHSNEYLQRSWNKNRDRFSVGIIEIVDAKEMLLTREQHWMDFFQSANRERGFNLTPTAGSNLGFKKTEQQILNNVLAIRGTRESILTQEEASKVKTWLNEGYSMQRIADKMAVEYDTIRSIRRGHSFKYIEPQIDYDANYRAKLVEEDVILIKKKINKGYRVKDIAEKYDVSHRTISAIKNEINWKNVGDRITIKKRKKRERSA